MKYLLPVLFPIVKNFCCIVAFNVDVAQEVEAIADLFVV